MGELHQILMAQADTANSLESEVAANILFQIVGPCFPGIFRIVIPALSAIQYHQSPRCFTVLVSFLFLFPCSMSTIWSAVKGERDLSLLFLSVFTAF